MMGAEDFQAGDREKPVHHENVSGYYMGQTEVPQWLWAAVMGSNPSYWKGDNLPVESVSLDDCEEFLRRLNHITGKRFRLPTEPEWEYAARGGNENRGFKYSGSNSIRSVAWYEENSKGRTYEVANKEANELGLHDMTGNVWEWTSDHYSDDYNSPRKSPHFVKRGGCCCNNANYCRVTNRCGSNRTSSGFNTGFRLAP